MSGGYNRDIINIQRRESEKISYISLNIILYLQLEWATSFLWVRLPWKDNLAHIEVTINVRKYLHHICLVGLNKKYFHSGTDIIDW